MIKICKFRTIHVLILDQYVSQWAKRHLGAPPLVTTVVFDHITVSGCLNHACTLLALQCRPIGFMYVHKYTIETVLLELLLVITV